MFTRTAVRRGTCRPVVVLWTLAVVAVVGWFSAAVLSGAVAGPLGRTADAVMHQQRPKTLYPKSRLPSGWAVCSFTRRLLGTEILQVQASRMSCSQAARAIGHPRLQLSPAGPIFAAAGYTCVGKNLEPVTPAPSQLPELVRCSRRRDREFRFIWIWG